MKFQKYHCLGNDYLILTSKGTELSDYVLQPEITRKICNRNFGLGADGVLVGESILKSKNINDHIKKLSNIKKCK